MTPESATAEREAAAPSDVTTPRPMREDDLLDFVWITDPQISPDGRRVAFTRVSVDREADRYRTSLWIAEVSGGEPRALSSGDRDAQPRWSPDGRMLAFVRTTEEKQPPQLYVLPMDGGEARALTTLVKGASSPAWSPDGKRIAFNSGTNPALDDPKAEKPKHEPARVVTRPEFRENNAGFHDFEHRDHLWVIDVAGGEPRQLTRGAFAEGAPTWARDGQRILFTSDRRAEPWFALPEASLYAVSPELTEPTDGDALELWAQYRGPIAAFSESRDGRFAAIGAVLPETPHAYDQMNVLLLSGVRPMREAVTAHASSKYAYGEGVNSDQHPPRGGGSVPLVFSADGKSLYAQAAREGSAFLMRIDLASGAETELTPQASDLIAASATPDGTRWAMVIGGLDRPADLHVLDTTTGEVEVMYRPNQAVLEKITLGSVEPVWIPSFDGASIHGWIVKPPDFDPSKQYPMVLEIHGGPHTAYGAGFFHEFQVLAGAGYVVLYTNPRGSTSYGWEFAHCIQHKFPGDDAKDLLAAVEHVVKLGYVDDRRVGVTGGSGGGLLTNWLVTRTQRFAAAITQRCVADWASMMYSCDFTMFLPYWFKRQPFEDPAEYAALSPITNVDKITTPLMVIHSEEDWRTPIAQGEAMFRALKYLRRPTVMVRFPGENHELSRSGAPSHRVQNQEHIKRWFDHWLMGRKTDLYGV